MKALDADRAAGDVLPLVAPALAIGVDAVEIARVAEAMARFGPRFLDRVFTAAEQARAAGRPAAFAARFAAKEAAAKALGTGIGPIGWRSIEIRNDARGKPYLILHDAAARHARDAGFGEWHLSLTHTRALAMAFVVGYRYE